MDELEQLMRARDFIQERVNKIKEVRGTNLTLREIAAECGVSEPTLSSYTRGHILKGNLPQICLFLKWLGVSPNDFLKEVGLWEEEK